MLKKKKRALGDRAGLGLVPQQAPPTRRSSKCAARLSARSGSNLTFLGPILRRASNTLTDSCYLIRSGNRYLLWDPGCPSSLPAAAARRSLS